MKTRGYAVGLLKDVELGRAIAEYLEKIESTMTPYGGRFLVHGGKLTALEGTWDGDLVIIEFPDPAPAREWYDSPGYQAILPLRTSTPPHTAPWSRGCRPAIALRTRSSNCSRSRRDRPAEAGYPTG